MKLHPNAVIYFMVQKMGVWVAMCLGLAAGIVASHTRSAGPALRPGPHWDAIVTWAMWALICLTALCAVSFVICYLQAESYRIDVKQQGVSVSYGILTKTNEILLFNKIQDIVITRNILERLLGLSTVVIQNALGKAENIPGLETGEAEEFRETILSRTAHHL